jgi:DNA-binding MarR family transcriptional regulator
MQKKTQSELGPAMTVEIEKIGVKLRQGNFWHCVNFEDITSRYCDITMKTDNISPLHAIAMWHLVYAGGVSTPTRLAETLFRSKHSVTEIVDNLEKEGLVVRDFSSRDRRVTQIRITQAGLQYIKRNQEVANGSAKQVMACLTPEQQKTMLELMEIIKKKMMDILYSM